MAEGQEDRSSDDLTEEASPYRVEELRRKGQVAQSRELTGMVAFLASAIALYTLGPSVGVSIAEFMRDVFSQGFSGHLELGDGRLIKVVMLKALKVSSFALLPIFGAALLIGSLTRFAQIGAVFSTEPMEMDLSKIDPLKGLGKFMSMKMVTEGFRLLFKIGTTVFVAYGILKTQAWVAPNYAFMDPQASAAVMADTSKHLFLSLVAVLFVFAGFDFWMQKRDFQKNVRMTKQEAKQEHREREGDPALKARVRAIQRDMARKRMMAAVKKADVIITNPTHIAIAIQYDRENMLAPKVVAKGADFVAQRIKQIASEAGVPMVENVPLARTLFKTVKVNQVVPRVLYQAVAEVLAYVYRLRSKGF